MPERKRGLRQSGGTDPRWGWWGGGRPREDRPVLGMDAGAGGRCHAGTGLGRERGRAARRLPARRPAGPKGWAVGYGSSILAPGLHALGPAGPGSSSGRAAWGPAARVPQAETPTPGVAGGTAPHCGGDGAAPAQCGVVEVENCPRGAGAGACSSAGRAGVGPVLSRAGTGAAQGAGGRSQSQGCRQRLRLGGTHLDGSWMGGSQLCAGDTAQHSTQQWRPGAHLAAAGSGGCTSGSSCMWRMGLHPQASSCRRQRHICEQLAARAGCPCPSWRWAVCGDTCCGAAAFSGGNQSWGTGARGDGTEG